MKKQKGITLVSLVITIIILLILAGISIAQLKSNELFENAKLAKDISNKNEGEELLKTKIYEYHLYSINKNDTTTLEGLKEYLNSDKDIENIDLYTGETDKLEPIKEGEIATFAKIKLKKYKYEYTLNNQLEVIKDNKQEENSDLGSINIDSELEVLLKEANMKITLEDILNTPEIMNNVEGLIQTVTENDVTRSETEEVVTYITNKGEMIRTNSEDTREIYYAWKAFDGEYSGIEFALSKSDKVVGYYLEYEFKQNVYSMKINFKFHNGSSYTGTRDIAIQGFDEENKEWIDLTEDITITGEGTTTGSTFPLIEENLNYSKSYKKYRLYVKNATGAGVSGILEMKLYGKIE